MQYTAYPVETAFGDHCPATIARRPLLIGEKVIKKSSHAAKKKGRPARARAVRAEELLATLAGRVRFLRHRRGHSQKALAARAGLSARFIAQLESGAGNISVTNLAALAAALEAAQAVLLGEAPLPGGPGGDGTAWLRGEISGMLKEAEPETLRAVLGLLGEGSAAGAPPPVIALIGLRGAGKSTVGPLLAEVLGVAFVELDGVIQELTGLATGEIYEMHGEVYYRVAEGRALREIVERAEPVVIAVSGGIVGDPDSFALLRERTRLVWLRASAQVHMERVRGQGDRRPMQNRPDAMAELMRLLRERQPLYQQARIAIDTGRISPRACAERLASDLRRSAENPARNIRAGGRAGPAGSEK